MACFDLTGFEWDVIQPLLQNKLATRKKPMIERRRVRRPHGLHAWGGSE